MAGRTHTMGRGGTAWLALVGTVAGWLAWARPVHAAAPFTVAEAGTAQAVIQVPPGAPPLVAFAAQELQTYLTKLSGATFVIENRVGEAAGRRRLVLGDCEESRRAGLDVGSLPPDGFFLQQAGDAVYLCGQDDPGAVVEDVTRRMLYASTRHGTLLAVYSLLEDVCGIRWLFPGEFGEYVPRQPTLVLPPLAVRAEPGMKMRTVYVPLAPDWVALYGNTEHAEREYNLFLARLRYSTWRMATSHYFAYEYSASRWVKTHPEYFLEGEDGKRILQHHPTQGWYLDFTQPGLAHEVALDAIAYFQGKPAASRDLPDLQFAKFGTFGEALAINPADTPIRSARDRAARPQVSDSDVLWTYYKRVSDEVQAACPGKLLSVWSYAEATALPSCLTRAPENTRIYLVDAGPFDWMVPARRAAEERRLQEWSAFAGHKLYLWINMCLRACRPDVLAGVPSPVTRSMGPWLKAVAPYVDGVYFHNYGDEGFFEAVNTYLYFHLTWDPTADPEAILQDYYAKAYGPAATIIRSMEATFEELWQARILSNAQMGERQMGDVSTLPTRMEIWEDIYTQPVIETLQERMAAARAAAKGSEFEKRVEVFAEYGLGALLRERDTYYERLNLADAMRICAVPAHAPPTLDGKLDEPDWQACPAGSMVPLNPGETPVVETQVRVLYDRECLYAAFRCQEPQMGRLRTAAAGRDQDSIWKDDEVEVFIDPAGQRRSHYQLLVNAAGACTDYWHHDRMIDNRWSAEARFGIAKGADAWTIEIAVPFASLNATPPAPGQRWLGNFCRSRALSEPQAGESQFLTWSTGVQAAERGGFNNPTGFGTIVFAGPDGKDPAAALNLLQNGDFEAGLTGWGGSAGSSVDTEVRHTGASSLRLEAKTAPADDPSLLQRFGDRIKPNTEYVLTYYMKTRDVAPLPGRTVGELTGAGCEVFLRGDGWAPCPTRWVAGTTSWRKYVTWVNSGPQPNPQAAIRFRLRDSAGTAWIDSVDLRENAK
jgi:hypothetical protein